MNWVLLNNSLLVGCSATFLAVVLGFFTALWAVCLSHRWQRILLGCAILAFALPPFLVTNTWLDLLGQSGSWRRWCPFNIVSMGGAVWILALLNWPVAFLLMLAWWRKIEPALLDAEPALCGGKLLRWLLFPMARPALGQSTALILVLTLNNFAVPAILQVKVFPAELWVNFNTTFDYGNALRMCWPMLMVPFAFLVLFRERRIFWPQRESAAAPAALRRQLGGNWFHFAALVGMGTVFFSVVVPLWQLARSGATWSQFGPAWLAGQNAAFNSVTMSAAAATVILVVAVLAGSNRLGFLFWWPFLIPGVLLGIALIRIFNRPLTNLFYQSAGIVILAWTLRYLAPCWSVGAGALRSFDRQLIDAARLDGAGRWQLLRHVQGPLLFPHLAAAWYISYLLCLWDVETLILVVPPGRETVALRVFNLLHYGHNSQVNALCLLLLLLAALPLAIFAGGRFLKSLPRRTGRRLPFATGAIALLLSGCGPSQNGETPVASAIFSRVEIIGSRGTGVGQFNKPRSLAVDRRDNLYVVDMTGRVQKFSPSGNYLLSWQMPQTDLGKPKGMCCDGDGNIVVVEPHYQRVNHFSLEGKLISQWGVHGTNGGQLTLPRSVAVNSRGEILVTEYTIVDRLQSFSAGGRKWMWTLGVPGGGAGEFNRAEGICVDRADRIYVADSCNHRIQVFSAEGKFLRFFGRAGKGAGELSYPYDVRVDREGREYVCEFGNSRIQVFDAHDRPLEILGEAGSAPGRFGNPWSIALDSRGNLYVADSQNHRVQKFIRRESVVSRSAGVATFFAGRENSPAGGAGHP